VSVAPMGEERYAAQGFDEPWRMAIRRELGLIRDAEFLLDIV